MNWKIDISPMIPGPLFWAAIAVALLLIAALLFRRKRGALAGHGHPYAPFDHTFCASNTRARDCHPLSSRLGRHQAGSDAATASC